VKLLLVAQLSFPFEDEVLSMDLPSVLVLEILQALSAGAGLRDSGAVQMRDRRRSGMLAFLSLLLHQNGNALTLEVPLGHARDYCYFSRMFGFCLVAMSEEASSIYAPEPDELRTSINELNSYIWVFNLRADAVITLATQRAKWNYRI
jgi:hypothetical protein